MAEGLGGWQQVGKNGHVLVYDPLAQLCGSRPSTVYCYVGGDKGQSRSFVGVYKPWTLAFVFKISWLSKLSHVDACAWVPICMYL